MEGPHEGQTDLVAGASRWFGRRAGGLQRRGCLWRVRRSDFLLGRTLLHRPVVHWRRLADWACAGRLVAGRSISSGRAAARLASAAPRLASSGRLGPSSTDMGAGSSSSRLGSGCSAAGLGRQTARLGWASSGMGGAPSRLGRSSTRLGRAPSRHASRDASRHAARRSSPGHGWLQALKLKRVRPCRTRYLRQPENARSQGTLSRSESCRASCEAPSTGIHARLRIARSGVDARVRVRRQ